MFFQDLWECLMGTPDPMLWGFKLIEQNLND